MHHQDLVRSRMIAARLRQFRIDAGLSGDSVARNLGWSPSKISRIELYQTGLSLDDLHVLLDYYRVRGPDRTVLDKLAGKIRGQDPDEYAEAVVVMEWSVTSLPTPVRTSAYARGVLRAAQPVTRIPPRKIETAVQVTYDRQVRLDGIGGRPLLRLRLCLDEAVLSRQYGNQAVMDAQLARLHELGTQANIGIRLLPLRTIAIRPPSFTLFSYTDETSGEGEVDMPALAVEHAAEMWSPVAEDDIFLHQLTFDHLWSLALTEDETLAAIRQLY
jgi:transcriptional regulator with XRE-family HTH domain